MRTWFTYLTIFYEMKWFSMKLSLSYYCSHYCCVWMRHSIIFATVFKATVNCMNHGLEVGFIRWLMYWCGECALLFGQSSVSFQEALRSQHTSVSLMHRHGEIYAYSKKNKAMAFLSRNDAQRTLSSGFSKYKNLVKMLLIILELR